MGECILEMLLAEKGLTSRLINTDTEASDPTSDWAKLFSWYPLEDKAYKMTPTNQEENVTAVSEDKVITTTRGISLLVFLFDFIWICMS